MNSLSSKIHFSVECFHRRRTVIEPPTQFLGLWVARGRVCEALWYRVVKEVGQVFSLSNDIESTMASRFRRGGQCGLVRAERCTSSSSPMEEILCGSVWNLISILLVTDDVMLRTAARRWKVGYKYGWSAGRHFLLDVERNMAL